MNRAPRIADLRPATTSWPANSDGHLVTAWSRNSSAHHGATVPSSVGHPRGSSRLRAGTLCCSTLTEVRNQRVVGSITTVGSSHSEAETSSAEGFLNVCQGDHQRHRVEDHERARARDGSTPTTLASWLTCLAGSHSAPMPLFYIGAPSGPKLLQGAPIFAAEVRSEDDYGSAAEKARRRSALTISPPEPRPCGTSTSSGTA
jgi:hypothetical protein